MLSEELIHAIELCRAGEKNAARSILKEILIAEPKNETAWLWFIDTLDSDADRIIALEGFLKINPESQVGQRTLDRLRLREKKRKAGEVSEKPGEGIKIPLVPKKQEENALQNGTNVEETPQEPEEKFSDVSEVENLRVSATSGKARRKIPGWLLRLMITFFITLVFALIFAQLLGYDPIQSLFGPKYTCGCDETKAYMQRVSLRVEKWTTSEGLLEISQLKGEAPSDISYAEELLQEEKDEKVQSCMQTAHEILLSLLEAHVQFAVSLTEKNASKADIYLQVQQIKQQELRDEFGRFSKGYSCQP